MGREVVVVGAGIGLGRDFYGVGATEWLERAGANVRKLDILALTETRYGAARALAVGYMTLSRWPMLYDLARSLLDRRKIKLTDREKLAERLGGRKILSVSPVASGELVGAGVEHSFVVGDFWVHESVRSLMIRSIYTPVQGLAEGAVVIGGAVLPTIFAQREFRLSQKIRQLESGKIPEVGFMVNGAGADMVSWLRSTADVIREEKIRARFFVGTNSRLFWNLQSEATRLGMGGLEVWWAPNSRLAVLGKSWVTARSDVIVSPTANENVLVRPIIFRGDRNQAERANARMATAMEWGMRAGSSDEIAEVLRKLSDNRGEGLRRMLRKLENNLVMDAGEKMARHLLKR